MSRGGVQARNYVLHIDDPGRPGRTYCGLDSASVNRTTEPEKLCEDEGCRRCVILHEARLVRARRGERSARSKTFDARCHGLATVFLDDEPANGFPPATEAEKSELASTIQQAVEDWLEQRHHGSRKQEG